MLCGYKPRKKGQRLQRGKKRRTVNSHVTILLRRLMDFQWDFIWKWWVRCIHYTYVQTAMIQETGEIHSQLPFKVRMLNSSSMLFCHSVFVLSITFTHHTFYYFMLFCLFCALFLKLAFGKAMWFNFGSKWNSWISLSLSLLEPRRSKGSSLCALFYKMVSGLSSDSVIIVYCSLQYWPGVPWI